MRVTCWKLIGLPVMLLMQACGAPSSLGPARTPYLDAAVQAGKWLQEQRDLGENGAIPDEAGSDSLFSASLGTGAAGRTMFFLELFAATGDTAFLRTAETEGLAVTRLSVGPEGRAGLYNGLSGEAFALMELAKISPDGDRFRNAASARFDWIVASGDTLGGGLRWGSVNDVIVGAAGTGLTLLYGARELDRPDLVDAAARIGVALLNASEVVGSGLRWHRWSDRALDLPNFSHGTAGVAYFLAELSAATDDPAFLDAAMLGADYLIAVADTSNSLFLVPYGIPNEGYVTQYDIGWAHGPAGTVRLFYKLWRLTGDDRHYDIVAASAHTVLAAGVPGPTADSLRWTGPFGIDRRFGLSGVIPFLVDAHKLLGRQIYLDTAGRVADVVLQAGRESRSGRYWTISRFGFQGEGDATFTGYFYGSAGMGRALLEMHHALVGEDPFSRLPDDPF